MAYTKIFKRLGLGHLTYITFASGGMFSKYSHEFQTISSVGEDVIYVDEEKGIAINKEVYNDEVIASLGLSKDTLVEKNAVEVGNIFTLGTRFSEPLDLTYQDENGEKKLVVMGSYGIGPGRVMGTIVEALSDEKGIIWPESVAPFSVHLLVLGEDEKVRSEANSIYEKLVDSGVEVLFDDRSGVTAGEKFADSDLIGVPLRAVVSSRSIEAGGIEIKKRVDEKGSIVSSQELITQLTSKS